jgi:GNAT superfamily N-acetyltransferase
MIGPICEAADAWASLGAECTRQAGALFLRDVANADVWDANHARIGGAGEPDLAAFFEAAEAHYAHCAHRAVRFDPRAPGGALEAELLRRGWQCELFLLMALEGPPHGMPGDARVADVETEADWATFAHLKQAEFDETHLSLPGTAWRDHIRRKAPVTTWIASLDDEPVGLFSSLVHGEIAMLEDLFVLPAARRRGVATTLVAHAVERAHRAGASLCFLSARADDTPKDMYARMGFRAAGVTRSLLLRPRS